MPNDLQHSMQSSELIARAIDRLRKDVRPTGAEIRSDAFTGQATVDEALKYLKERADNLVQYTNGEVATIPSVVIGYATSGSQLRFIIPMLKRILTGYTLTVDATITGIRDTTNVSVTVPEDPPPAFAASRHNENHIRLDITNLSGLTSNRIYRATLGGNRRITFTTSP